MKIQTLTQYYKGNVVIRYAPDSQGKPTKDVQLVLYDHGVYQKLDSTFRLNYAHLWEAIIMADEENIIKFGEELGAGEFSKLLACMMANKSNFHLDNYLFFNLMSK